MKPLVEPSLLKSWQRLLAKPHGSYLWLAPEASGKFYICKWLIEQQGGQYIGVEPTGQTIKISQIQEFRRHLQLKTTNQEGRVAVIRDADKMTLPAQNALLKVLEEPPDRTAIILLASERSRLLATILSRVQVIEHQAPSLANWIKYFSQNYQLSAHRAGELAELSQQRIGLAVSMHRDPELLNNYQALKANVQKLLAQGSDAYSRLQALQQWQDKQTLILGLEQIAASLQKEVRELANSGNIQQIAQHNKAVQLCHQLARYLEANGSLKLAITQLGLSI